MTPAAPPAKITRPHVVHYLSRPRLFHDLDRARTKPVIWIAGPAGSGKTTLVSTYVAERNLPALWFQVDEGDTDLASFFYYLGLAGRCAAPRRKAPLPLLTPEYLPGLPVYMRRFFQNLLGRMKNPSVLVFDNCQAVPDDALLHSAFLELVSQLPGEMSLILISRTEPPPRLARLRAHEAMEVFGWRQLSLTLEETAGIAGLRGRGAEDGTAIERLHHMAGGWTAGLVLLLERARIEGIDPRALGKRPPEEMMDYFGSQVLDQLQAGIRDFLLRSAFLPHMTAEAVAAVTGNEDAGRVLALLHRHNAFIQKHPVKEPVYEYHPLFREFLTAYAREAFPPEEIRRIRQAAAAGQERAGRFEDAVVLYREAEDVEGLVRVVLAQAPQLLGQGRHQMLLEWLGHLPPGVIEATPWLQCWKAFGLLPLNQEESLTLFERVFHAFRSAGDATGTFLAWTGVVESIMFRMEGQFGRMDSWISEMEELLREHRTIPGIEIESRVTSAMAKALYARRRAGTDVEGWAQRAAAIVRNPSAAPPQRIESLLSLALLRLIRGDLSEVEQALAALRGHFKGQEVPALLRLTAVWMETAVVIMRARFDQCLALTSEGLALAEKSGVHLLDGMLLGNAAHAQLLLRNLAAARALLERMEPLLAAAGPWIKDFHQFLLACETLCARDTPSARRHAERSVDERSEEVSEAEAAVFKNLLLALVAHDGGDENARGVYLARARPYVNESNNRLTQSQYALVAAYFLLENKHGPSAPLELADHLRVAREAGVYTSYVPKPGLLERVAAAALEAGVEVEYARELIRRNRLRPGPEGADLDQWPWPVKVYTLGGFELHREGEPVSFPRKVQQRPLLLLKTLVALGGRDVPEERLADALWPEADGDLAHQSFTAALHRLRQLLGTDESCVLKGGRLTLSESVCWVDAWAFERRLARPGEGSPSGNGAAQRAEKLERALSLYRGPFLLGESDGDAVSAMRARLQRAFLRGAEELGGIRERGKDWERAIACYRRAVEADECSEPFVRRLIACCLRIGREVEARAVFESYARTLAASGRGQPSTELARLLNEGAARTS